MIVKTGCGTDGALHSTSLLLQLVAHSPVDDGEEVDDPEAGPEHEVGGGGRVEQQQQGEGHGGCCVHRSARGPTVDRPPGHWRPRHRGCSCLEQCRLVMRTSTPAAGVPAALQWVTIHHVTIATIITIPPRTAAAM